MIRLLPLVLFTLLLASCGPTLSPFTQQLYEEQGWTEADLERIQFYLSEDIVLTRQLVGGSSKITRGEIRIVNGRKVQQFVIRKGTPGVYMFSPKVNRFAISFEEGGTDRYLIFGPNPKIGNRYAIRGSDFNRSGGTVTYDGLKWQIDRRDALANLMVDLKRVRTSDVNSRVARGRRID